jgi:hypothetical protein
MLAVGGRSAGAADMNNGAEQQKCTLGDALAGQKRRVITRIEALARGVQVGAIMTRAPSRTCPLCGVLMVVRKSDPQSPRDDAFE